MSFGAAIESDYLVCMIVRKRIYKTKLMIGFGAAIIIILIVNSYSIFTILLFGADIESDYLVCMIVRKRIYKTKLMIGFGTALHSNVNKYL